MQIVAGWISKISKTYTIIHICLYIVSMLTDMYRCTREGHHLAWSGNRPQWSPYGLTQACLLWQKTYIKRSEVHGFPSGQSVNWHMQLIKSHSSMAHPSYFIEGLLSSHPFSVGVQIELLEIWCQERLSLGNLLSVLGLSRWPVFKLWHVLFFCECLSLLRLLPTYDHTNLVIYIYIYKYIKISYVHNYFIHTKTFAYIHFT